MDRFKNHFRILTIIAIFTLAWSINSSRGMAAPATLVPASAPVGLSFTYEGRLGTRTGPHDFKFRLFADTSSATPVVATVRTLLNVPVSAGEYVVSLNFGAAAFTGEARYLEVLYRTHSDDPNALYAKLSGRPAILPVAYALSLRPGATVSGNVPSPGAVVRSTNIGTGVGLWGSATSNAGVHGEATTGIGVRGVTQAAHTIDQPAIYGISTGNGGIGVIGEANIGNSWGLYGTSTDGTGIYAASTAGIAIHAAGDATQDRTRGGWVKAMAYIDVREPDRIRQCYNSQAARGQASSGNCGFTYTKQNTGQHLINFGFPVSDRFVVVTQADAFALSTGSNIDHTFFENTVAVTTFYSDTSNKVDASFFIFIY